MDTESRVIGIEQSLSEFGSLVWKGRGHSMEPLIRTDTDFVVIEKAIHPLNKYDVALYRKAVAVSDDTNREYVLHRIISIEGESCILLGDNCVTLEYVDKDDVVAVMRGVLRNGREIDLDSLKYKMYLQFWIKPWRMRIAAIKLRSRCLKLWWKFVEIASPYTPKPIKKSVKRMIMKND